MQIANVTVEAYDIGRDFRWGGRRPMDVKAVLVSLAGDDGQQGNALAWTAKLPVRAVVAAIEDAAVPHLIGADPLDRPRILAPLWCAFRVGSSAPGHRHRGRGAVGSRGARRGPFHRRHARTAPRAPPRLRERPARRKRQRLRSDGGRAEGGGIPGRQAPRLRRSRHRHRGMPGRPAGSGETTSTS